MLISAIIAEIIQEVGGDTSDSDLTTLMFGFFKSGLRRIPAFIRDRILLAEGTLSLGTGEQTKSLSGLTGFVREREVWYLTSENKRIPIMTPRSTDYFHRFMTKVVAKPLYYRIYGTTIQFNCPLDSPTTIGFDYFKEYSNVSIGDTFLGTEDLIEAAKDFCKMIYYADYAEDAVKGADHERKAKELIKVREEEYEAQEQGGYVAETNNW